MNSDDYVMRTRKRPKANGILIVDDETTSMKPTLSQLQSEGFLVKMADDGELALDMLDDNIGLVFTDYIMPRMNGYQLLLEIKKRDPEMHVCMVTGNPLHLCNSSMLITPAMMWDKGLDGYIYKGSDMFHNIRRYVRELFC